MQAFLKTNQVGAENFYAAIGPCAFKTQEHTAYYGLAVSEEWPRIHSHFVRLGFSACPQTADDFLRVELAYDVQRGEWITTVGAAGHEAFALLLAIARAHTPQLMAHRSAWLQVVCPFHDRAVRSCFLATQAAEVERLRASMQRCFAARDLAEIDCMVARHQRLYAEQRLQHQSFQALERTLFRLNVQSLSVFLEVLPEGPSYYFDFTGGLPHGDQAWLEPLASQYVLTLLEGIRPGWSAETGLHGQVRLRSYSTGFDRSVRLSVPSPTAACTTASSMATPVAARSLDVPLDVQLHFKRLRRRMTEPACG